MKSAKRSEACLARDKAPASSLAHRVSPRLRLGIAFAFIFGVALLPRRLDPVYGVPAVLLAVFWPLCRAPFGYTLRRMLVMETFILGLGLLSLFWPGAAPLFLSAVVKSNFCILALVLLTWTTPFQEILQVLRGLRLPSVMLSTVALMYRYLPVLAEETRRMQRARASRTFNGRRRVAWVGLGTIIGQLFIRSVERAERIYLAMCARGWK
jgi:cobalt/nickel transport system permease protein